VSFATSIGQYYTVHADIPLRVNSSAAVRSRADASGPPSCPLEKC
jgi:hypothetical protein